MSEIRINKDGLRQDVAALKAEIANFQTQSNGFFDQVLDLLAPMNSDFIIRVSRVLNNMRDNRTPELNDKLDTYVECLEITVETFRDVDEALAIDAAGGG